MKNKKLLTAAGITIMVAAFIFNACSPLREFSKMPPYQGNVNFKNDLPAHDSLKKTVVILSNNEGTELFDMMAPYYLFNNTGEANVYIIAKNKYPVVIKKGFYVLPQLTFNEMDSSHINPDVIVIPFLSVADSMHQDPVIVNWIKGHYLASTKILAVCDGSATAAATGIFDGKPITAHASDYPGIRSQFSKPIWIQNTSVANSGNLFSTAGVSNAVEGCLMVIKELFGSGVMRHVKDNIGYPYAFPKTEHKSNTFSFNDKVTIGKKIILRSNKKIGVLLQDGINEFDLAAVMDTYNRSFPKSIESFSENNQPVKTKYGLIIIPGGKVNETALDELHVIGTHPGKTSIKSAQLVTHSDSSKEYIIDECLHRIRLEYGQKFEHVVKLMLDYN